MKVSAISWKPGGAVVEGRHASGAIIRAQAKVVLITAPVALLRAPRERSGGIDIRPMPHRVRRALEGFEVGAVMRLVLWFRELPWKERSEPARFNFLHFSGPFQVLWTVDPVRFPVAIAWCGGPDAAALSRRSRSEILDALRAHLARGLGVDPRRLQRSIRNVWWHDWNRDPYARGAYTYTRVGASGSAELLSRPEARTLFFAGEATDPKGGTVEAALASGRRAALQIHRSLGRA